MEQTHETTRYDWKEIVRRGLWSFSIPIVSMLYNLTNKYRGQPQVLETFVDKAIPFNRFFIIPYLIWYGYVCFFLLFLCGVDKNSYFKLLITVNVGVVISALIFFFFPTYVPRPVVSRHDIFSDLVLGVYKNDNPYNCFPSLHVLHSVAVAMYVNESNKINKKFKIASSITAILIILSTMFVKQHYFADVASATLIAYSIYFVIRKLNFNKKPKLSLIFSKNSPN